MVLDELALERVRALLVDGAVAVGLGPELGDEERLRGVVAMDLVQERAEHGAVVDLAAWPGVPAVVAVDAECVEYVVCRGWERRGIAGVVERAQARRIDLLQQARGVADVALLPAADARRHLVADRPREYRRVVLVARDGIRQVAQRLRP